MDYLTSIAMEHLASLLDRELEKLAGERLGFTLVVADGERFACTANMPPQLAAGLLTKAAADAMAQAEAACDTRPPAVD